MSKLLKISGLLYFALNCLIFATLLILNSYTTIRYQQLSSGWLLLLIPIIGMFSGYWVRIGKHGWAKKLIIAVSLLCSAVVLFIALVAGPQMDTLKAQKFEQMQQQTPMDEETQQLFLGLYSDDLTIIKEQLDRGVDVNVRNATQQTPLHVTQDTQIVRLLIERGADVNAIDDMGMTPIFNKEVEIASLLLAAGTDINAISNDGNTAFLWYSYSGYFDGIKFLITSGADINACNSDNNNALDIAKHFHPQSELLRYLQSLEIQDCSM